MGIELPKRLSKNCRPASENVGDRMSQTPTNIYICLVTPTDIDFIYNCC